MEEDPMGSGYVLAKYIEPTTELFTVGHGTLSSEEFVDLLTSVGTQVVIDVRSAPGSRRHPHFGRARMEQWLSKADIGYYWEPDLGGYRRSVPGSVNTALRHPAFRGYADYMATSSFSRGLSRLLAIANSQITVAMCAETLWWRCHRRLIADAAVLLAGAKVSHLDHHGKLSLHRVTEGARSTRVAGEMILIYD